MWKQYKTRKSLLDEDGQWNSHRKYWLYYSMARDMFLLFQRTKAKEGNNGFLGSSCDSQWATLQTYPFFKEENYSLSPYNNIVLNFYMIRKNSKMKTVVFISINTIETLKKWLYTNTLLCKLWVCPFFWLPSSF